MKIVVALRSGLNATNPRSEALAKGAEALGHKVRRVERAEIVKGADLLIQTGFAASNALMSQIDAGKPYIIMEASPFRMKSVFEYTSYGYNGLAGGSWAPPPPEEERWYPPIQPEKTEGGILIVGQKPTDHSLRGSDHVRWIEEKRRLLPEADFRPHPLMAPPDSMERIEEALARYREVHIYTSTVGVDAFLAGCKVCATSDLSWYGRADEAREQKAHRLSWRHFSIPEMATPAGAEEALRGYDEAAARAAQGLREVPRGKIDGISICEKYYRSELCRATP